MNSGSRIERLEEAARLVLRAAATPTDKRWMEIAVEFIQAIDKDEPIRPQNLMFYDADGYEGPHTGFYRITDIELQAGSYNEPVDVRTWGTPDQIITDRMSPADLEAAIVLTQHKYAGGIIRDLAPKVLILDGKLTPVYAHEAGTHEREVSEKVWAAIEPMVIQAAMERGYIEAAA